MHHHHHQRTYPSMYLSNNFIRDINPSTSSSLYSQENSEEFDSLLVHHKNEGITGEKIRIKKYDPYSYNCEASKLILFDRNGQRLTEMCLIYRGGLTTNSEISSETSSNKCKFSPMLIKETYSN